MRRSLSVLVFVFLFSALALTQTAPIPFVNQPLHPTSVIPGHPAFTLTVTGTAFRTGAVVNWSGSPRTTTFISSSKLQAAITAADVAHPGTAAITVTNPGVERSNTVYFTIHARSAVAFARRDIPLPGGYAGLAVADFNNDGKPDVLVGSSQNSNPVLEVFLGNGDGTFQSPIITTLNCAAVAVLVADFNGDGKLDVLAQDQQGLACVSLGNGDGTFAEQPAFIVASETVSIAADLNRDGKIDAFVVGGSEGIYGGGTMFGRGDGTFRSGSQNIPLGSVGWPAFGDFNRDGKLDVAIPDASGSVVNIYLGNGDGTFGSPVSYATIDPPLYATVADVNGDGKLDIVTSGMTVLLGKGDGTFTAGAEYSFVNGLDPQFGDFNNDGKLDVILVQENGAENLDLLLGNGDGTFQSALSWHSGLYAFPVSVGLGDFNGDGRLDAVDVNKNALTGLPTLSVFLQTNLSLSSSLMDFGFVKVGTTSGPQTATLTNIGKTALPLSSISLSGSNYLESNDCGTSLSPGASCTVSVTFTPTSKQTLTATVRLGYTGTPGSPQYIELHGVGI